MSDLTVIFYTSNRISERFAQPVREHLARVLDGTPVISVSQRPLWVGVNICVGEIGCSAYNVYKQALIGAKTATTPYVAMAEDDFLYAPEHFAFRPPLDTFAYDHARWTLDEDGVFWYRSRNSMGLGIMGRELLIETLEERFAKYPVPLFERHDLRGWGEPGRYEGNLKLPHRKMATWVCPATSVIFNHRPSLGGKRRRYARDLQVTNLPGWGDGKALWEQFHG